MVLEEILSVANAIFNYKDSFSKAGQEHRERLSKYFLDISECLKSASDEFRKHNIPDSDLGSLKTYASNFTEMAASDIGFHEAAKLSRDLSIALNGIQGVANSNSAVASSNSDVDIQSLRRSLNQASGVFKALANSLLVTRGKRTSARTWYIGFIVLLGLFWIVYRYRTPPPPPQSVCISSIEGPGDLDPESMVAQGAQYVTFPENITKNFAGAGSLVNPFSAGQTGMTATLGKFAMSQESGFKAPVSVFFGFNEDASLGGFDVYQSQNGITEIKINTGESRAKLSPAGDARSTTVSPYPGRNNKAEVSAPPSYFALEGQIDKFALGGVASGRWVEFAIVDISKDDPTRPPNGWGVYRVFPWDAAGKRIPACQQ